MFFWNFLAFSMMQHTLAIWSLAPLSFLNLACTSGSSQFTYCWSLGWRIYLPLVETDQGFPCGSAGKESARNAGDLGLIPGLGRSPGEGKGYPVQYSVLENSMDLYSPCGRKESDMTERLSLHFTETDHLIMGHQITMEFELPIMNWVSSGLSGRKAECAEQYPTIKWSGFYMIVRQAGTWDPLLQCCNARTWTYISSSHKTQRNLRGLKITVCTRG